MRSSNPCLAAEPIFSTISASLSSASARKTCPVDLIDRVTGLASTFNGAARVCGRSSGTPTVMSGAATMKMTRSTSMTSMNGVILISLITPRRPRRRRRPAPAPTTPAVPAIALSSGSERDALVDLAGQDGGELVGKPLEPGLQLTDLRLQLVVGEHCRDRGEEADRRREEGLGDPGRDHGQAGVFRRGDRSEGIHDAPDRPEQADIGAGGADRGEDEESSL